MHYDYFIIYSSKHVETFLLIVFMGLSFTAARGREGSVSTTYDTFVPNQVDGLQQLIEFQQQVKAGSLTVDEALELFSDWQHVQKDLDAKQQVESLHALTELT